MKLKAAFKFQIRDFLSTVLMVYGFMLLLNIIGMAVQVVLRDNANIKININGGEIILIMTVLILAMSGFKEDFQMLMQNGVSRKNIFKGKLCAALMFAVILTTADSLYQLLLSLVKKLAGITKSTESIWIQIYQAFADGNSAVWVFISFALLSIAVYVFSYMLGTALSGLSYRMNQRGRTALAISLPITIFVLVPILLDIFWETAFVTYLAKFVTAALGMDSGIPYPAAATFAVLACIAGAASWLVIRKAVPKD